MAAVRQIVLLRGINVGSHNRIAMASLRELLASAGFADARTYLQSGNVVLSSDLAAERLGEEVARLLLAAFGLQITVIVRTREELAGVVELDPLRDVATHPKRYQVSFLAAELDAGRVQELARLALGPERLLARGRELYSWHPEGVARSKLWNALASGRLGVATTARNWATVANLLELADG
jgi:uncharacterized protein (DUF1697 family)